MSHDSSRNPLALAMVRFESDRACDALKEHELVVDATAEHDGELAEWLMRRHIRSSRQTTERHIAAMWG